MIQVKCGNLNGAQKGMIIDGLKSSIDKKAVVIFSL